MGEPRGCGIRDTALNLNFNILRKANGRCLMAKKLNKNLVIGLAVLGFTITTIGGVVMVKVLQTTDPTEFAARADKYRESEDWPQAYQYYQRAYRTSQELKFLVSSGDMLRKMGREQDALKMYQSAVVMAPDMLDAQEKILDLQLEMCRMSPGSTDYWLNTKSTAEAILDLEGQEGHPRALYAMGAALLGLKEQSPTYESEGVEYLQKAIAADPKSVEPVRRMVNHLYRDKRTDEARQLLETIVANNTTPGKDAAEARTLYADFLTRQGEYERAAKVYDEARSLAGTDAEVQEDIYSRACQFWATRWAILKAQAEQSGTPDPEVDVALQKAISAADDAIKARPEGFDGYVLRAELYRRLDQPEKAIEVLKKRLELPFVREGFQSFFTRVERFTLLTSLADLYTSLAADEARGSDKMQDYATQARMCIEDARGEFPERAEASVAAGKLAYILGEFNDAVKSFERAEQQSVRTAASTLQYLALARLRLGQVGGALEAIQHAVTLPDATAGTWTINGQILLQLERPQDALSAANEALRIDPESREARVIRTAALEALNRIDEAQEELATLESDQPALIAAKARFLANQDKRQEAIDYLQEELKNHPDSSILLDVSAQIYKEMDRIGDAQALIANALKSDPDNFDLRVLELRYQDLDDAERAKRYEALVKTLPDEFDRALRLSTIYEGVGDTRRQAEQLEIAKGLIANKSTERARSAGESAMRAIVDALLEIYSRDNEMAKVDALIDEAAAWNDGEGLDGAEGLSYQGRRKLIDAFQAQNKRLEAAKRGDSDEVARLHDVVQDLYGQAIDTLQLALDKFPTSGQTCAQLGEAYLQVGRLVESRAALEKADALLPKNGFIVKRLAQVCQQLNDQDAYQSWLARCQDVVPDDPWVTEQLLVQKEESNPREGIARRKQLRAKNPDDRGNLIALARLYAKIGDITNAEECINSALPLNTEVQDNAELAELLREIGKPERALEILSDAVRDAPDDQKAAAQLLVAAHYAAVGDPQADAAYLAAGDIDPNERVCFTIARYFYRTSRFKTAEEYLDKAAKLAASSQSVQHTMVQQLRIETAVRLDNLDRAKELCDEYAKENPDDPSATFLRAEILSAQGHPKEAIDTLSEFLTKAKRGANALSDYRRSVALYRRAQFYFNRGFWQDAIDDLVQLSAADPGALNFAPRILLSQAYEKVGRTDASFQELEQVYAQHPEASEVVKTLVDKYIAAARLSDADRVLAAMLNREPENVDWLTRSGEVAVKQKDRGKALENFRLAATVSGYAPEVTNRVFDVCDQFGVPEMGIEFFEQSVPPNQRQPEMMLGYAKLLADRGDIAETVDTCRLALRRKGYTSFDFLRSLTIAIRQMFGGSALKRFTEQPPEEIFKRADDHILAMIYHSEAKYDEALKLNQELLASSTDPAEKSMIWYRIGYAYDEQADYPKAEEAYKEAIKENEANLPALNNLAYLLSERVNQAAEAIKWAELAVEAATPSTYVETLDTLGWAYFKNAELQDAVAKLSLARENDATYIPATYHLAETYRCQGDFEASQSLFESLSKTPAGGVFDSYVDLAREGLNKTKDRIQDGCPAQ